MIVLRLIELFLMYKLYSLCKVFMPFETYFLHLFLIISGLKVFNLNTISSIYIYISFD